LLRFFIYDVCVSTIFGDEDDDVDEDFWAEVARRHGDITEAMRVVCFLVMFC
jgi:hypothetical protein